MRLFIERVVITRDMNRTYEVFITIIYYNLYFIHNFFIVCQLNGFLCLCKLAYHFHRVITVDCRADTDVSSIQTFRALHG